MDGQPAWFAPVGLTQREAKAAAQASAQAGAQAQVQRDAEAQTDAETQAEKRLRTKATAVVDDMRKAFGASAARAAPLLLSAPASQRSCAQPGARRRVGG